MNQEHYQFAELADLSFKTANKIVPILTEIIGLPHSVIDLGGGTGAWCKAFKQSGSSKVCCVDHPSVLKSGKLLLDEHEFFPVDLLEGLPPIRPYDLAISTEVCEHLPESRSEDLVNFLTSSSKIILFSAAIPRQGGLNHINEQRPSFWKKLFEKYSYKRLDIIRPLIIFDSSIPAYIRQNLYFYTQEEVIAEIPEKFKQSFIPDEFEIVEEKILKKPLGIGEVLEAFPLALSRSLRSRLFGHSEK